MDDERRLTKLIVNNNLGYVKIKEDLSHICIDYTRNLSMEKKREKGQQKILKFFLTNSGMKEAFVHKLNRKAELLQGCAAASFVSLVVSFIIMIPGIGKVYCCARLVFTFP
jgi:hypothetical protein